MNYIKRQKKLIKLLESKSLDAYLIRKKQNISYLVGTKGEDALLFASCKKNFLITDARYREEYTKTLRGCTLRITKDMDKTICIKEISKENRFRRIGFESNNFTYLEYADLKKKLNDVTFLPLEGIVEELRMIKDADEIQCIREACKYGSSVMKYALKTLRPGLSEDAVKNKIMGFLIKRRLKKADFEVIVASGKNASMPHASPSSRKIGQKDMVIIDLGTTKSAYNSDLTRTSFLGRIDPKSRRIYNIVLEAQKKAIESIKPGIQICYIDTISRQYITAKGLGRYFIHSLGHGIGLEVHEKPRISGKNKLLLQENMTITIEPGIYIPGWGGIRVEDVVLVTRGGCEVLTKECRNKMG